MFTENALANKLEKKKNEQTNKKKINGNCL